MVLIVFFLQERNQLFSRQSERSFRRYQFFFPSILQDLEAHDLPAKLLLANPRAHVRSSNDHYRYAFTFFIEFSR